MSIVKIIHQPLSTLSWVLTISTKWEIVVHMKIFCFMWSDWRKSYHTVRIVAASSSTTFDFSLMSPPIAGCSDQWWLWWFCVWHLHMTSSSSLTRQPARLRVSCCICCCWPRPRPIIITSSLTMMDGCDWKVSLAQESPVVIAVLWHLINHHAIIQPTRDLDPGHVSIISQSEQCCC